MSTPAPHSVNEGPFSDRTWQSPDQFFSPVTANEQQQTPYVSPAADMPSPRSLMKVKGFPSEADDCQEAPGKDWDDTQPHNLTTVKSFLGRLTSADVTTTDPTIVERDITMDCNKASNVRVPAYSRRIRVSKDDYLTNFRVPIGQSYVIRKRLGQGSWGAVHEAVERSSGFLRAIKKIPKKADLTRFRQEMTILKGFDHPRIIRLYETFEDYGHLYMVMEYCRGGELFDRLTEEGPLPEPVAAFLMKQILSALAYCHSRGVVHRDLKPENFMFFDKDIRSPLKLVDFGLAKRVTRTTKMTSAVGTIYYLAPELLVGEYDYKVDCWSAGIILYTMLFGTPPFVGDSETHVLRAIRDGNIDYTKRLISNSARDLIMSLCCRDAERRVTASEALNHAWFKTHWPSPLLHLDLIIPLAPSRSEPYTMTLPSDTVGVEESPNSGLRITDRADSNELCPRLVLPNTTQSCADIRNQGGGGFSPGFLLSPAPASEFCCDFAELQSGHSKRCAFRAPRGMDRRKRSSFDSYPPRSCSDTASEEGPDDTIHLAGALTHLRKLGVQNQEEAARLGEKLIDKWKHFASLNPLKRAMLSLAAQQLEHARELSYIRTIFDLLDIDGDGILSKEEVITALNKLRSVDADQANSVTTSTSAPSSLDSQNEELSELTAYVDLDGNGQIEYSEFAAACLDSSTYTQESTEKAIFRLLDRDGDGLIGQGELKRALGWSDNELAAEALPPDDSEFIQEIIKDADADEDGYIGTEDFKALLDSDGDNDDTTRLYNADDLPPPHICTEAMGRSHDQFDFSAVARSSFYNTRAEGSRSSATQRQAPHQPGGTFTEEALNEIRRFKLEQSRMQMARCMRDQFAVSHV
eukprot:Blabericola_migrator_1__12696@NODE_811_length_6422_cov_187_104485_g572_i0_p1_GENE_NODE_811_length_6422_cov_187_104485_g572_i0NODE_811_length_6422_cov_187_104485_g572_i0_p1_ORF_typecomplete_len864_score126_23Pkinase/PF00069_25/1_8e75Pkinase_Tyr/PF07714_17/3_4e46EFhand_7/PF13499_6/3_4e11EFhand_7/PF13499_6/3_6e11EFhand_8/PF13833_6/0_00092EFhand_8/PF13833_6/0_032EFhand_8/PF13833_6/0_02EFhand_8/PF13833_6/0_00021EFhand_1/PF00036_32/0_0014EFhand_1/PF00036_32/0_0025EFhand_1/PF00036_32/0_0014EFhand_1/PF0